MAKTLVTDKLWAIVKPLLPPKPPKPKGGRPRIDDRAVLTGILFVLKSGIPWEMLPQEMGCGSGKTCWRRLKEWHEAGVWDRLYRTLLDRLGKADKIFAVRGFYHLAVWSYDAQGFPSHSCARGSRIRLGQLPQTVERVTREVWQRMQEAEESAS